MKYVKHVGNYGVVQEHPVLRNPPLGQKAEEIRLSQADVSALLSLPPNALWNHLSLWGERMGSPHYTNWTKETEGSVEEGRGTGPLVIYIASPYRKGSTAANVALQITTAHHILDLGHVPIAPLLNHFLDIYRLRPESEWIQADLPLVAKSDIVLRVGGESEGGDGEVDYARMRRIPVCFGLDALNAYLTLLRTGKGYLCAKCHSPVGEGPCPVCGGVSRLSR